MMVFMRLVLVWIGPMMMEFFTLEANIIELEDSLIDWHLVDSPLPGQSCQTNNWLNNINTGYPVLE